MIVSANVDFAPLVAALRAMGDAVSQRAAAEEDLMAAAAPMVDAMRSSAPRDPGGRPGFAAETIHSAPQETRSEDELARIALGSGPTGWYLSFSELGTSSQAARPWMRPAVDSLGGQFVSALGARLAERIKGAL